jgi:hypothetical protein
MTWHYIFEKTNPRLVKYQRLTAHPHAATVEDQLEQAAFPRKPASTEAAQKKSPSSGLGGLGGWGF